MKASTCYCGLASVIAGVVVYTIVKKHNKKVQEKSEAIKDKIDETLTKVKENEKVEAVTEKVKETGNTIKEKVKAGIDTACIKAFNFALNHPKAAKRIAYGVRIGIVALNAFLIGSGIKRMRERKIYAESQTNFFNSFVSDSGPYQENFDKFKEFCEGITLHPDELFVIENVEDNSGALHTHVSQIYGKGSATVTRF